MMTRTLIYLLTLLVMSTQASAQALSLEQITAYLNSMRAAKANFVQANPDKTLAQGVMYLEKPGRIRYEYTAPADSLVISDGRYLGIFDKKSNRGYQRFDLRRTPLDILLRDRIDLTAAGVVRSVQSDGTKTEVIAGDPANPGNGSLTMVFTSNPTELRQWIIADKRGRRTTVILSDLQLQSDVSDGLFDILGTASALRDQ